MLGPAERLDYRITDSNSNGGGEILQATQAPNFSVADSSSDVNQHETAMFSEATPSYSLDMSASRDPSYNDSNTESTASFADFFSRPVRIHEGTWSTTAKFFEIIDPWVLWQSDARVKSKLTNFAFMSCDLHLRVVINGNPFQYGRLCLSYVPYGEPYANYTAGSTLDRRNQTFAQIMRVHKFYQTLTIPNGADEFTFQHLSTYPTACLNPATSEVAEIICPFLWHNNYLSVNGTSVDDKESPGVLTIYDRNRLRVSNDSASTSVNFTVYAWAENMKLVAPTEFEPIAGPDEFINDFANKATTEIKNQISKVPVIGKLAKATDIGALSEVAMMFGFSAPRNLDEHDRTVIRPSGRMANCIGGDSSISLGVDPKQEVTIDPQVAGATNTDELEITSLITREQWLARCEWGKNVGQGFSDVNLAKLLFATVVSPTHLHKIGNFNVSGVGDRSAIMDCPGGHYSHMFAYWKGSITYRVEVVCSKMHAGRLKLQFDPFTNSLAKARADFNTEDINARFTAVLDLAKASEMEFTIPFTSYKPWLRTMGKDDADTFTTFWPRNDLSTEAGFALDSRYDPEVHMGIFTVSIVNELVAPIDTSLGYITGTSAPVQVNVFVKMGPDMRFAQPSNGDEALWLKYRYQSIAGDEKVTDDNQELVIRQNHELFAAKISPLNSLVFFGEEILSMRALFKRYSSVYRGKPNGTSASNYDIVTKNTEYFFPHYPPHRRGYVTGDATKTKSRLNHAISYLMPSFVVVRGSMRWKVIVSNVNTRGNGASASTVEAWSPSRIFVERFSARASKACLGAHLEPKNDGFHEYLGDGSMGAMISNDMNGTIAEFELPFYSSTRFYNGTQFEFFDANGAVTGDPETIYMNPTSTMPQIIGFRLLIQTPAGRNAPINLLCAGGEDLTMSFFTGIPMVFQNAIVP